LPRPSLNEVRENDLGLFLGATKWQGSTTYHHHHKTATKRTVPYNVNTLILCVDYVEYYVEGVYHAFETHQ